MTAPTDPKAILEAAGLSYNDRVKLIAALGLPMPDPRPADAVANTLLAHIEAGGSLTPPSDPPPASPGVIKLPVIECPGCRATGDKLHNYGTVRIPDGKRRYYLCRKCGRNFKVLVRIDAAPGKR